MRFTYFLINKLVYPAAVSLSLVAPVSPCRLLAQAEPAAPAPSEAPAAQEPIIPANPALTPAPAQNVTPEKAEREVNAEPIYPAAEPGVVRPETPKAPTITLAPGKGFTITSADERFSATVRSRVQLRDTYQTDGQTTTNEPQVRTLRLILQGHVLVPELKYAIQLAFGAGDYDREPNNVTPNPSPIYDAFVEYTKLRDFNVRVGQYFVPLDRARTIREFALQFVDRQASVREFALDRDMGIMFSSTDLGGLKGLLSYNVFVGGGKGKNRIADPKNPYGPQTPGVLLVGRVVLRPMGPFDDEYEADIARTASPKLAVGVGGGYNISTDRTNSTFGTTYTAGTFNYAHGAADVVFKWKGFSFLSEALLRDANKNKTSGVNADTGKPEYSRSGWGYFVQGGQMLYKGLEAVARWDDLYAFAGTDPKLRDLAKKGGRQVGGGFNYYLNGHAFKFQTDYFYVFDQTGAHHPNNILRFQVDATF